AGGAASLAAASRHSRSGWGIDPEADAEENNLGWPPRVVLTPITKHERQTTHSTFSMEHEGGDSSMTSHRNNRVWTTYNSYNTVLRIEQNSPLITQLNVYDDTPFTVEDWIRLGRAVGGNTNIVELRLRFFTDGADDDPIRSTEVQNAFCAGLARNRSIQKFQSNNIHYTSEQIGIMRPFFSHNASLTRIKFDGSELEPGAIGVLTEAIKKRGGKCQDHSFIRIQIGCWVTKTSRRNSGPRKDVLPFDKLDIEWVHQKLDLYQNRIRDDGCMVIAESLRTNKRLRWLSVGMNNITSDGFASFIPAVYDTSSIDSTLNSNHTLEQVTTYRERFAPRELLDILRMNKTTDKRSTAKLKVLRCHFFDGNFDMTAIASLDMKLLPCLLGWFARLKESKNADFKVLQSCRSTVYRMIQRNPELCRCPHYENMRPVVQIEKETDWSIALEAINTRHRLIAYPVMPKGRATSSHVTAVNIRISPPGSPLAYQISPKMFRSWAEVAQVTFTEISYFDLHWPDNSKPATACEYDKVLAAPHHVIAAQSRRRPILASFDPNDRFLLAVLNFVSHELAKRALEQPPRCLLDQRQAVDGIGPLPSERLARERHLAKIPSIEQGGQEKHDVGIEERRLNGCDLLPLNGIERAGHGTGGCLMLLWLVLIWWARGSVISQSN
ncbi:hypothetical protein THAOC_06497, partial [Thalassiosira oceanica]